MRYVELIKYGFIVAGNLNDEEIREHLADGYRLKWQQTLRVKKNYRAKKKVS